MTRWLLAGALLLAGSGCTRGPVLAVDAGHGNRHTLRKDYDSFGALIARRAGTSHRPWSVRPVARRLTAERLEGFSVLTLATATEPYTAGEVDRVASWVDDGGGVLLVVDHHPFDAASTELAARLGVSLSAGRLIDRAPESTWELASADGTLLAHPVTEGPFGTVDRLRMSGARVFEAPAGSEVGTAPGGLWWKDEAGAVVDAEGMPMLAAFERGAGRVVVVGDGASLACKASHSDPALRIGFCHEEFGPDHEALVLNVVTWLAGG